MIVRARDLGTSEASGMIGSSPSDPRARTAEIPIQLKNLVKDGDMESCARLNQS